MIKRVLGTLILLGIGIWAYNNFLSGDKGEAYKPGTVIQIGDMVKDPRFFDGKIVTVEGEVASSMSLGVGTYVVTDGTGKIRVITTKAVPLKGEKMKVTGRVGQFAKIGQEQMLSLTEK